MKHQQEEHLARQWAKSAKDSTDAELHAAAEFILRHTQEPTMEGVVWDDAEHYLAGAVDGIGTETVMLEKVEGIIRVLLVDEMHETFVIDTAKERALTPNGKRYRIQEITESEDHDTGQSASRSAHADGPHPRILLHQTPKIDTSEDRDTGQDADQDTDTGNTHPKVLRSYDDLEKAPAYTVIANPGCVPFTKDVDGCWYQDSSWSHSSYELAEDGVLPSQVLRWGRGSWV